MDKWYDIFKAAAGEDSTKVMLYDDIGAWGKNAKDFANEFDAIATPKIDLHIHSYGGEILDGLAIYNTIKNHKAEVTVHIDGIAASIASVIALAGDKVCISKSAYMMIHNGWGYAIGDPAEMRKQADVLDKLCNSLAEIYSAKSGKKVEDIRNDMDAETWLDAGEAKAYGLVDEIENDDEEEESEDGMAAMSILRAVAKYQKTPPKLRKFAASLAPKLSNKKEPAMAKPVKFKPTAGVSNSGTIPCPHCSKDIEVELETPPGDEDTNAKLAKAREDGVKAEREYRNMFNTVLASAGLTGKAATEFEATFYGRAEADLKFLASHAIGTRAKPVGEGNPGNGEGEQPTDEAKIAQDCAARFKNDNGLRRRWNVNTTDANAAEYKAGLDRLVKAELKWAEDQKKQQAPAK